MSNREDQGPRRRRNSITLAILQRSHETATDFFLCPEGDERDYKHAIIGYQNQAISSPILIDFSAPCTSRFLQNIERLNIIEDRNSLKPEFFMQKVKNSKSMQNIDQVNIIRGTNIVIGPTVEVLINSLEPSDSTNNLDQSEIIRAVQEMNFSGNIQNIENLNIFDGEGITFATTIQAITQRVEPEQRIIEPTNLRELESESTKPKKRNRIRCFVAVFVCLVVVVGCAILLQVVVLVGGCGNQSVSPPQVQLRIAQWWYKCRWSWRAEIPNNITYLTIPIRNVVIGNSESHYCDEEYTCMEEVRAMQQIDKIEKLRVDIIPNFIVTPNGLVFEGRGASVQGAMLNEYNNVTITIMFLGDYERNETCSEQFEHLEILLTEMVDEGVLAEDYKLLGECQISKEPLVSPGPNVMNRLSKMDHFYPGNEENCVTREDLENKTNSIAKTRHGLKHA